ncbi:MAG: hypothetical protein ACMUIG_02610 [Thermoplasmatota archaeon]
MKVYHAALAVMLISVVFLLGCIEDEKEDMELEIMGLEHTYDESEYIVFEVRLTNNDEEKIIGDMDLHASSWNGEGNRTLDVFVTTPEGYKIHCIGPVIESLPQAVILRANQTITESVNLSGIPMGRSYDDLGNEYQFGPGLYSIYAVYTSCEMASSSGMETDGWQGSVRSRTHTFRIKSVQNPLELDPVVKVTNHNYTGDPRSVPYQDIHDKFSSKYTGSDVDSEFRDALSQRMSELSEDVGENGTLLRVCINATYSDLTVRPNRIPTYAEKCTYNGEDIWAIAFNRCNGWEDGIGHFDLYFVSIPVVESGWVHGCNVTAILHCDGCY